MQVCGGSQSFNVVNALRVLGRWMRMFTIPNQSSVPKAWLEFEADGRMKDSPYRDRLVDVMEELWKFTLLTRDNRDHLVDRYSERREAAAKTPPRNALPAPWKSYARSFSDVVPCCPPPRWPASSRPTARRPRPPDFPFPSPRWSRRTVPPPLQPLSS